MAYYFTKIVSYSFDQAIERAKEELQKEGFGVLTEVDVTATLKAKLGVDFRKYRIIGACNPLFAHMALLEEDKIGTMLPCNLIVQEHQNGSVEVSAINPTETMHAIKNSSLSDIAGNVTKKLQKIINNL